MQYYSSKCETLHVEKVIQLKVVAKIDVIYSRTPLPLWRHLWTAANTVRPLLSAVLERNKFWSQKPRIIEIWLYFIKLGVLSFGLKNRG